MADLASGAKNLKNKLVEGVTSMNKPAADELTFEGIKKHHVISFEDEQSKIDTLKELIRGSRKTTIVVFVKSYMVPILVREMQDLSQDGWKVLPINGYKSKKLKDKIMQELSQSDLFSRVFITTEGLSRSARWFDFEQVRLVINYDLSYHPVLLLHRMGRFKEADAIYFVNGFDWPKLVDTQTMYNVDFEVSHEQWPTGFCLREEQQIATDLDKEFPCAAQDIRHFVYQAQDSSFEWKLTGFLNNFMKEIIPRKSVVFVNALKEVNFLVEEVRGTYGKLIHSGEFQVFIDYSKFRVCEGCCMLITHDEAILDIDPPKNVPWVINYDPPSTMVLYDRRIAWCKGRGVVVHFVVSHDWLKVFYIPIRYNSFLSMFPGEVPD